MTKESEQRSVLLDLANDTKKIAQVFPLMNKHTVVSYRIEEQSPSSKDQSVLVEKENKISDERQSSDLLQNQQQNWVQKQDRNLRKNQNWNLSLEENKNQEQHWSLNSQQNQSQSWSLNLNQDGNQNWNLKQNRNENWNLNQNQDWLQNQEQKRNENHGGLMKHSSITLKPEHEQHPAYYKLLTMGDQEEFRKSSFDNSPGFRRPGTGRKLPSTEHLERSNMVKSSRHSLRMNHIIDYLGTS
ncbi:hypothetical protein FO519_003921 [Halicephalobus sp. NKZ332]|nr:hypothetical protein FO519_003921 [Halicephalobus sp. NKZ332]